MKYRCLFTVLCLLSVFPLRTLAFEYTYNGVKLYYDVIDEDSKTCAVAGIADDAGIEEIVIPSLAKDTAGNWEEDKAPEYSVVMIKEGAFAYYLSGGTYMASVTMPNTIKII